MAQQHLDRLTSIDASFLVREGSASPMHIGAVLLFEGPPPKFEDYLMHVCGRLHRVPRYRQKLATPPLQTGRPMWIDDPTFKLENHVRHTALPFTGTEEQLLRLAARIASQRLDRSKPLWENWLVEGLDSGGFALIFKTHHSMVDGVSGVDLATVLLDIERTPGAPAEEPEPWHPRAEPSPTDLVLAGARGFVETGVSLAERAVQAATDPMGTAGKLVEAAEGIGELVWAVRNRAPQTPLNVEIGPHRRYAVLRQELDSYREVKNRLGGTVNDVILTVVAGALARWLRARGIRTQGMQLHALVPVSVRTERDQHMLGNRLTAVRGPLPVSISDPVARLHYVSRAMDGLKESKQAVGASAIARVNNLVPPTILAQVSRLQFSARLFNLLVTNIPGPQFPLYLLGRQLENLFPVAFLPPHQALAVAIMSYNGGIDFGLLADYDALPDLDLIVDGIRESLEELLEAARFSETSGATPRVTSAGGVPRSTESPETAFAPGHTPGQGSTLPGEGSRPDGVDSSPASIVPAHRPRPKRGPAADMRARRSRDDRGGNAGGTPNDAPAG